MVTGHVGARMLEAGPSAGEALPWQGSDRPSWRRSGACSAIYSIGCFHGRSAMAEQAFPRTCRRARAGGEEPDMSLAGLRVPVDALDALPPCVGTCPPELASRQAPSTTYGMVHLDHERGPAKGITSSYTPRACARARA